MHFLTFSAYLSGSAEPNTILDRQVAIRMYKIGGWDFDWGNVVFNIIEISLWVSREIDL